MTINNAGVAVGYRNATAAQTPALSVLREEQCTIECDRYQSPRRCASFVASEPPPTINWM
jgi:hypothetical protein